MPLSQAAYVEVGKLPKALITNTDFVPLMLHHSSPATPVRKKRAGPQAEESKKGRFLYTLFSLIAAENLPREVVLLAVQILEMLAKQSVAEEVYNEVIKVMPRERLLLMNSIRILSSFCRNIRVTRTHFCVTRPSP
jgi:hypothetical protein